MTTTSIDWFLNPVIEKQKPVWRQWANCKDVPKDVFVIKQGQSTERALWFCETCVVRKACLEYALDNNCVGIWGGTTQKQRAKIKRQQGLSNAE